MKKILSLAFMVGMLLASSSMLLSSCTYHDTEEAIVLSGQWQGNWGMYYEVEDPWGNIVAFDSYDADIVFYPDYDYATHGYGYQVDWYNEGPYERMSYRFHWSITSGIIHLTYPGYPEYNSDIRDYHLNYDRFRGYFTNGTQPFELYKIADYYNWSYYYEWDYHYWPYAAWSWDVYYYGKARPEMDTRTTADSTEAKSDSLPHIVKIGSRLAE